MTAPNTVKLVTEVVRRLDDKTVKEKGYEAIRRSRG